MNEFIESNTSNDGGYYFNIKGERCINTPVNAPYSHDAYCIYKNTAYENTDIREISMVYSDRLIQWDREKFDTCCKAVFGKILSIFPMDPPKIQSLLQIYFGKNIKILGLEKACNVSNGYPYLIIYYKEVDKNE